LIYDDRLVFGKPRLTGLPICAIIPAMLHSGEAPPVRQVLWKGFEPMQNREKFSSRLGFLLISAGCAIGLGNVYRFPIWCGAYGGGIFLVFYLAFLLLLGIPVMTAELAVGRASKRSIATSFDVLQKKGQKWHWMKYLGVAANYLLMMFYTSITGWFFIYFFKFLNGSISAQGNEVGIEVFVNMITNPTLNITMTILVILLGFGVCAMGLQKGVERITKVMMTLLFLMVLGLAIYALTLPGAGKGLAFYFIPNPANAAEYGLGTVISGAMSQAFFTLSLGIGSIAIFGSYIDRDRTLLGESLTIVGMDTFVALMSGLVIFPAFFTFNPEATAIGADQAGAVFLFTTLSSIFNNMAAGRFIGAVFFLFVVFAAMSTVIAVFENIMSFWLEWTKLSRVKIAVLNAVGVAILTLPFIYSNIGGFFSQKIFLGRNFGDFEDFLVSNLALPIGSLVYVLFCTWRFGWGWDKYILEVNAGEGAKVPAWMRPYMTYVLPLIIIVVLFIQLF
jgi:NSS family neurotransmitter:Na+ symporter